MRGYCKPENKVSLGFVEGLNNKIRVIQRRAYGLRDEENLRLRILTCMIPVLSNAPKSSTLCHKEPKTVGARLMSCPHGDIPSRRESNENRRNGCYRMKIDVLNSLDNYDQL